MDIIDFYQDDKLVLPKTREVDSFIDYIKILFDNYQKVFKELLIDIETKRENQLLEESPLKDIQKMFLSKIKDKSMLDIVSQLCKNIQDVLQLYLEDRQEEAYLKFKTSLSDDSLTPFLNCLISKDDISSEVNNLYRFRISENKLTEAKDLFHIPFQSKNLVNSYRYSVSGVPCLYLAGSTCLCWKELDRPSLENVYVSRVEANSNCEIKVLNFAIRHAYFAALLNEIIQGEELYVTFYKERKVIILPFAICWPLIAACSIRVKDPKQKLIPEYIIPQLLMRWVQENKDCDGIRYFSTKIEYYPQGSIVPFCNFAFPVKILGNEGYCEELSKKFKLTKPLLWTPVKNYENYTKTDFCRVELVLRNIETELIK